MTYITTLVHMQNGPEPETKSSPAEEYATALFVKEYSKVVPEAWDRYLEKLRTREYVPPRNEAELRYFVFSEMLDLLRKNGVNKPYQIFAEDPDASKTGKSDLSLGWIEEGKVVAVEFKLYPEIKAIEEDILKLRSGVQTKTAYGYFLMLGYAKNKYREKLDFNALDIEQEGKHSWVRWESVKQEPFDAFECLIVFVSLPTD